GGASHGSSHLETITECDGNNVCKRPTAITWEAGSTEYLRQIPTEALGSHLGNHPSLPDESPTNSNVYRRIIMRDVNNDGRDDLIYRDAEPLSGSPTGHRLGWTVRINTTSGSTVSFGNQTELAGSEYV